MKKLWLLGLMAGLMGWLGAGQARADHHMISHHAVTGCEEIKKVCVPVPDKRRTTKVIYSCEQEDFCLPKCPHLLRGLFSHGCCHSDCGPCQECEAPRCRNVLYKKTKTEECDSYKCEVRCVVCPPKCPPCPTIVITPPCETGTPVEVAPPPKPK